MAFGALLVAALILAGCGTASGQRLEDWTLHARGPSHPVHLPVHLGAELGKTVGEYRLSTEVTVGEAAGADLDLFIPYLPAQVALVAGGVPVPPAAMEEFANAFRHVGPHRWTIPASSVHDGRLSLELRVSHGWTQAGWLDVAPVLVPAGVVPRSVARIRLLNGYGAWFGMVGLSQVGIAFLALFMWDRRLRASMWFGIQGLTASYYPAYVLGFTTAVSSSLEFVLLAQALAIAPIVSVRFTHAFFGLGRPHRVWDVLLVLAAVLPIPALFGRFLDVSYGTPGVIVCVGTAIAYQIATGVRLLSSYPDRGVAVFFLCCWLALGGSAWVDLWAWIGGGEILEGGRPACVGLGLFGMFQSMLLSRAHFRSLRESERLNVSLRDHVQNLEARQAEIVSLNEELRQQVERRSAHILAALARGDGATAASFEPGDVVEDRYRVVGAIGSGGMGTVYEVERLHDRKRLALKVTTETREHALARLAREAQLALRVRHPNVVSVVDADVAKAGYVYLVMELVEGCALGDCEGGRDTRWCLSVLSQILEGLGALHTQGIIHRDLKPANVLLSGNIDSNPLVKITDFGISRGLADAIEPPPPRAPSGPEPQTVRVSSKPVTSPDATLTDAAPGRRRVADIQQLTRTGAISGTPSYVAPELARNPNHVTSAVDVFSFGVVAYRLLTGKAPHPEAPLLARLDGREAPTHSSLSVECPRVSHAAAVLLDACLAFTPAERPRLPELLAALRKAAEDTQEDLAAAPAEA